MNPTTEARIRAALGALADELIAALDEAELATDGPERLLSIPDAAAMLGSVARSTVYRELQAGRLRSVKVAGRRMIPSSAIAEYARRAPA